LITIISKSFSFLLRPIAVFTHFLGRPFLNLYLQLVMPLKTKASYHPHLLIAFYLHCLPPEWLQRIPRSTRHEWSHKDQAALYGHEWALQNQQLFDTLREVSTSRRLLRINKALLRLIALKRFIDRHHARLKDNIPPVRDVVLNTIRNPCSNIFSNLFAGTGSFETSNAVDLPSFPYAG